ncbi:MAG: 23S rRNA (guanosine(2251)-2'-O)-methyltransferase RlmB [Desulfobacterales bacterium]|nr:23S rRNA (guanosine(2251)-2'-O)-methyltransferase RlmB [Desulfobacterales bacterium]
MKTEVLFGFHPVYEALKAGRRNIFDIYIAKDKLSARLEKAVSLAESYKIPVKKIPAMKLKSITGADLHQGIGARSSLYPFADLSDIIKKPEQNKPFLLLLDNVSDTHNLGALVRTALCVGVDGIVIPKDRSVSPTPAVSKISAGALEHILLAQATNMVHTIKELKKNGIWITGMDSSAEQSIFEADLNCPLAVVIGGEDKGIRPLVKKNCDFMVSVPQEGAIDSLNASVAGAVVMYEVFRQRRY